jgi:hypothetical protein
MSNLYFEKNTKEKLEWQIRRSDSHQLFTGIDINWSIISNKIREKLGYESNDFYHYDTFLYGWGLILRFKNKEDEAHFVMLASSGELDD